MAHPLENLAQPVNSTASGAGSANAANLNLDTIRKDVDIAVNATANALLTVEVSQDNSTWRTFDTVEYDAAADTPAMEQYDTAYPHVRAFLNKSHDLVELASKGID